MPVIRTKNSELFKKIIYFAQQLKCTVKCEEIKMNDLARIDLFTEIGIERQILLLSGNYRECAFMEKARTHSEILISPENCFEIHFNDDFVRSKFITQEYLSAVNHYFGGKIKLLLLDNSLLCKSKSPVLASFFYRAILADACDYSVDFDKVKFLAVKEVLKEILSEKRPLFLDSDKIFNDFGRSIISEDVVNGLEKFGYKIISSVKDKGYLIETPFFRSDIYSENDILEDIMLSNLDKFEGSEDIKIKKKNENNHRNISAETIIAKNLLNFGFKELSLFSHKGLPLVTSIEQDDLFRSSIMPSLLNYEISNQHTKYPHRLFEIGTVLNDAKQNEKLGILMSQTNADFNELYSIVHSIFLNSFEKKIYLKKNYSEYYEKGTSFDVIENKNKFGTIGILSLKFAKKIKLKKPCLCSEISLESITKTTKSIF